MAAVWVDHSAMTIETIIDGTPAARDVPNGDDALAHLSEAGWRVIVIGQTPGGQHLPDGARGWLLTSDEDQAREARQHRGIRTVLVGPATADRGLAGRAADQEARGLLEAVLMVLSAEAMPGGRAAAGV